MNKTNTISKYIKIKSFNFVNNNLVIDVENKDDHESEYIIYIKN